MPIMQALGTRERFAFGAVKQNRTFGQNALHQRGKLLAVSLAGRLSDEERFVVKSGIYQIENRVNGKRYIGSAVNIRKRWSRHLCDLRHKKHCNPHLQSAFDKYGKTAFMFTILEHTESERLIEREQHYFDTLNPEYNIAPTAGNSLGRSCSLESRLKFSAARMGHPVTEETRRKISKAMSGERNPNYGNRGKPLTAEHRAKISKAMSGNRHPMYGKHPSEESRRKMSEAGKAHWRRVRAAKIQEA